MKRYKVERTDKADELLHRIVLMIAKNFGVDVALKKLDEIEAQIMLLATEPEMGVVPKYDILRRQGYRVLILKKDLVFYKVDHEKKEVMLYHLVDTRRDYIKLIK